MNSMKNLTQLLLRSSNSINKKSVALKFNADNCYLLINRNLHTYIKRNNANMNNMHFKSENIQLPIQMRQSSTDVSTKTVRPKVNEIFYDELQDIRALFPDIIEELLQRMTPFCIPENVDRFKEVLEYNVSGGKNFRAGLFINAYKNLTKEITEADLKLAYVLAWCLEMNHAFLLMQDDIVDGSITRRNQLCWYKRDDVGLTAINDSLVIEHFVYYLLRKYFSHFDYYVDLLHLFLDVTQITAFGQANDLACTKQNVESFTREKYYNIVLHKTSYYTIYMPVIAAMHLSGCKDKKAYDEIKNILLELGLLYQIHDDFIDCFRSNEITGKIGTDIIENKCTFLAVECMHRANENQKQIMMECYGSNDPDKIARVKQLYVDLDLPGVYTNYKRVASNKIKELISQASDNTPKDTIFKMIHTLFVQ